MVVGIKRKLIYLVIYRITLVNREIIMYYISRIRLESLSRLSKYMSCIIQDDMFQVWSVLFLDLFIIQTRLYGYSWHEHES